MGGRATAEIDTFFAATDRGDRRGVDARDREARALAGWHAGAPHVRCARRCVECSALRGTQHEKSCSSSVRPPPTKNFRTREFVGTHPDRGGTPIPIFITIPKSENQPSAHVVLASQVPRRVAREEKQRLRKQRRALKERLAREAT